MTGVNDWAVPAELEIPCFDDVPTPPPPRFSNQHVNAHTPKPAPDRPPFLNMDLLKSLLPMLGKDMGSLSALLGGGNPDVTTLLPMLLQNIGTKKPRDSSIGKVVRLDEYTRIN